MTTNVLVLPDRAWALGDLVAGIASRAKCLLTSPNSFAHPLHSLSRDMSDSLSLPPRLVHSRHSACNSRITDDTGLQPGLATVEEIEAEQVYPGLTDCPGLTDTAIGRNRSRCFLPRPSSPTRYQSQLALAGATP